MTTRLTKRVFFLCYHNSMNQLSNKSVKLTKDIEKFLKEMSEISTDVSLALLLLKGQMLLERADILVKDLECAAENVQIRTVALQILAGLKLETQGLKDVVTSLKAADRAVILSKRDALEKQILQIKEKEL